MTIECAHVLLGVNKNISLNEMAQKYLNFKQDNPNITYIDWLEQEVIIQDKCIKLGVCEKALFSLLGLTREDVINNYHSKAHQR